MNVLRQIHDLPVRYRHSVTGLERTGIDTGRPDPSNSPCLGTPRDMRVEMKTEVLHIVGPW